MLTTSGPSATLSDVAGGGGAERGYQSCFRRPCAAAVTGLMITAEKTGHTALPPVACLSVIDSDRSLSFSSETDI